MTFGAPRACVCGEVWAGFAFVQRPGFAFVHRQLPSNLLRHLNCIMFLCKVCDIPLSLCVDPPSANKSFKNIAN